MATSSRSKWRFRFLTRPRRRECGIRRLLTRELLDREASGGRFVFIVEATVGLAPPREIELFFKELKSTLGFRQYRFRKFEAVEGWSQRALTTFLYLETRAQQLARRGGLRVRARLRLLSSGH